jgi:hypothetical protein
VYRSGGRHGRQESSWATVRQEKGTDSVGVRSLEVACRVHSSKKSKSVPLLGELTPRQGFAYISGRSVVVHHLVRGAMHDDSLAVAKNRSAIKVNTTL